MYIYIFIISTVLMETWYIFIINTLLIYLFQDNNWHEECFSCTKCDTKLSDIPFELVDDDKFLCFECYQKYYAPKCEGCKECFEPQSQVVTYEVSIIYALVLPFHRTIKALLVNSFFFLEKFMLKSSHVRAHTLNTSLKFRGVF